MEFYCLYLCFFGINDSELMISFDNLARLGIYYHISISAKHRRLTVIVWHVRPNTALWLDIHCEAKLWFMWRSTKRVRLPINTRRGKGMLHKQKTTWWARIVPLRLSLARCCQADASTRDVFRTNPLQDGCQCRHSLSHVAYHHSARFILVSFLLCIAVCDCIFALNLFERLQIW